MQTSAPTTPLFGSTTQAAGNGDQAAASRGKLSSDFDTFLRMLTVQMQNQDPLNPVEATDYATQLATFSAVEQQVQTNDLLRLMTGQGGSASLQQYGGWIGKQALVKAPVAFDGSPVTLRPETHAEAKTAVLVVRDSIGNIVERTPISPDSDSLVWTGRDETGAAYPAGVYRFDVESYDEGTLLETDMARAYSRIDEVRAEGGAVTVRLADGTETPASKVAGLRAGHPSE